MGVSLRFVYDYNMEYADAFPKQVDCLTLLIYDDNDRYVAARTVTGPELRDENYRMTLDLDAGAYRFVAYGGLACPERSFAMTTVPAAGAALSDLCVRMDPDCLDGARAQAAARSLLGHADALDGRSLCGRHRRDDEKHE